MDNKGIVKRAVHGIRRLGFLRGSLRQVLLWPIICLFLGALLWYWTLLKIDTEKQAVEKKSLKDTASLVHDYAQYLAHAIEQVDQITLQVKYSWELSHSKLNLQELSEHGIFRSSQILNVVIVNRHGVPVTFSSPRDRQVILADRDYFLFHRADASDLLLVGKPIVGRLSGKPVVTFTRRLNATGGAFDGVVIVSVAPSYFTSFYAGPNPGKTGLLAVVGMDGTLRAAKIGDARQESSPRPLTAVPLFNAAEGAGVLAGERWFSDKKTRFVAWETLKDYPLVAVVGLSEEELLAPHRETWTSYRYGAIAGSALMLVLAVVIAGLSARLVWKRHQEEEARKTYRMATESGNEGFYMYHVLRDADDAIVDFELMDCNERGAAFYGTTKTQLLGKKLSALYPASYFNELMDTFRGAMESGFYEESEAKIPRDSPLRIEWARTKLACSGAGLAVTVEDISERKQAEERLNHLAYHDALTDLPNRVLLQDRLEQAMIEANRQHRLIAVMFMDLDRFKHINDTLGHRTGDALLKLVAERLKSCVRRGDTVSRIGGDEFVLILANVAHVDDVAHVAQKIVDQFLPPFHIGERELYVTPSIGITLYPLDSNDAESLLKNADAAMYHAKESGRNTFQFYTAELNIRATKRLMLETGLRRALERNELLLHYQPLVSMQTGEIVGMEALLRWQHPELGLVPPSEFISLAEDTGLILPIGEWVMRTACAQAKAWGDAGSPALCIAVNLSGKQLKKNLPEKISRILAETRFPACYLALELTESILMQDLAETASIMAELSALGVVFSLDDFGTGYSSLSYLKRFPIRHLKIDRSFVRDITTDLNDAAIAQASIAMAHTLDIQVIAEGVETYEQLEFLRRQGCDIAQGYYYSKPLSVETFTELLRDWNQIRANISGTG